MWCRLAVFLSLCLPGFATNADEVRYTGPEVCGGCHKSIAATQSRTAMALTWHTASTPLLPVPFTGTKQEGDLSYEIRRLKEGLSWTAKLPGGASVTLPVQFMVGGKRHGLSFLAKVDQLDGIPLERPALIETRYLYSSPHQTLVLSPGFPTETPRSIDNALGRALSPTFEVKCLTCHGQPNTLGAGKEGGVHCESCHGSGWPHLKAISRGNPHDGIVNPAKLSPEQSLQVCSQCHTGFADLSDPIPDDLLVSNQVTALRNTECFIQSGKAVSCLTCHDPHKEVAHDDRVYVKACLGCHSSAAAKPRAAICPVNAAGKCIDCHMPSIEKGSFHLVDHWIRVHPEQGVTAAKHDNALRSQVRPRREFLRIIVTGDQSRADAAAAKVASGVEFFDVAREFSTDGTGPGGGYLGESWLEQMDPKLADAAARLAYGEVSPVIATGNGRYVLVQRLPRDFKYDASRLEQEGSRLRAAGELKAAAEKYEQALRIYPQFLRALIYFGATVGQMGGPDRAAAILQFATQLYPNDPAAQYNLGIALGSLGRTDEEVRAYERAISLEPDLLPAYQNLGGALLTSGRSQAAIDAYRRGLQVNPLSAVLAYNLSVALGQTGDSAGAQRSLALARKIDPAFVAMQAK